MLKPYWWLLLAHSCSAVAGFVAGVGVADLAVPLYATHEITKDEKKAFEWRKASREKQYQQYLGREIVMHKRLVQLRDA